MTRVLFVLAGAAAILGFAAAPVFAQTRVFVSGFGSDANPCTLGEPCRTLQQAHDTVAAGGEIVALDAAGYGPLNITKAVTVTAIGVAASITSNSANSVAITISAGASDVVVIRGLSLFSAATNTYGIMILSAKSVTIEDCTISGFTVYGIFARPNAGLNLDIRGTSADNNGDSGLVIEPLTGLGGGGGGPFAVTAIVDDSHFGGNVRHGIIINGPTSVSSTLTVTISAASAANGACGLVAGTVGGTPVIMLTNSKMVNNGDCGLAADRNVTMFVDRTQISGNGGMGWQTTNGAVVKSYTNNQVNGNGDDNLNGVTQITSQ